MADLFQLNISKISISSKYLQEKNGGVFRKKRNDQERKGKIYSPKTSLDGCFDVFKCICNFT
jgi:hypothetical protein